MPLPAASATAQAAANIIRLFVLIIG